MDKKFNNIERREREREREREGQINIRDGVTRKKWEYWQNYNSSESEKMTNEEINETLDYKSRIKNKITKIHTTYVSVTVQSWSSCFVASTSWCFEMRATIEKSLFHTTYFTRGTWIHWNDEKCSESSRWKIKRKNVAEYCVRQSIVAEENQQKSSDKLMRKK